MSLIVRRWFIGVVTLGVLQTFELDVRAEVDVRAEFQLARQYNEASLRLWTAEANVAGLRLEQLKKLRQLGHASWLEVAQAEVTLQQSLASQELEQEMSDYLSDLSKYIARHSKSRDVHAFRIIDPLSARLVGWIEGEVVVPQWADQFASGEEPPSKESMEAKRQKAEDLQLRVNQLIDAGYGDDSLELRFARYEFDRALARADLDQVELSRAQFEYDLHRAGDKNQVRSLSTALIQTTINSAPLSRATFEVVSVEAQCDSQIRLAELTHEKHQLYLAAIERLHQDGHASGLELKAAQEKVTDAKRQTDALVRRRDHLVDLISQQAAWRAISRDSYWQYLESLEIRHPTVLRHLIDLRRQRLVQHAACESLESQLKLAEEMGKRLGASSENDTREQRSNELDQRILRARIASIDELDKVLEREELRFAQHLAPKIQGQGSEFPRWIGWAVGQSAIGRLALCGLVVHQADKLQRPVIYLDTHSVIDPVSLCLTCNDGSTCCSSHEASTNHRLRSSASRIDTSWRTSSVAPIRLPRSALVSEYDLQRICSYYCDLPGSVCPQPNLGSSRLFSSYAVPVSPSRNLLRHDDWLGIRTVSYAISRTGLRKYSGLNYSGISVYEPVIRRVGQSVRYRPSFRTP